MENKKSPVEGAEVLYIRLPIENIEITNAYDHVVFREMDAIMKKEYISKIEKYVSENVILKIPCVLTL